MGHLLHLARKTRVPQGHAPIAVGTKPSPEESANTPKFNSTAARPSDPLTTATAIWNNPHKQGTPEARRESVLQCMEATWGTTFDRVKSIWPQGFLSTPQICAAEIEVERVLALVLSGKATLSDFRKAAEAWEKIVKETISIAGLEKDGPNKISI
jgi:hypothetical protein